MFFSVKQKKKKIQPLGNPQTDSYCLGLADKSILRNACKPSTIWDLFLQQSRGLGCVWGGSQELCGCRQKGLVHDMSKTSHCLQQRIPLSPAPTSCVSWDLMYATFVSKDLVFFHSLYCLYYFLQLQTSNNGFSQVDSAIFQITVMLLKPGLQTSTWKLRQKGYLQFPLWH